MSKNKKKRKNPQNRSDAARREAIQQHSAAAKKAAVDVHDAVTRSGEEKNAKEDQGLVIAYDTNEEGQETARVVEDTADTAEDLAAGEDTPVETAEDAGNAEKEEPHSAVTAASPKSEASRPEPVDEMDDEVIAEAMDEMGDAETAERAARERAKEARRRRHRPQDTDHEGTGTEAAAASMESADAGQDEGPQEIEEADPGVQEQKKPGRFHIKPWRVLTRTAKIAVIVVVCLILAGFGLFHYEYSRLQKVDKDAYTDDKVIEAVAADATDEVLEKSTKSMEKLTKNLEETEAVQAEGEIFSDSSVYNILLIGTDDRTKKFSSNARGDSCLLLSLNKDTGKVTLLSFERGIGVPILWGPYKGEWDWLTHSFRYGGADMMLQEIRDNFKVDVNRYIRINIRTLVKIIDAMGGIDIDLTEAEANHLNHPEGTYTDGYAKGIGKEDELQKNLVAGENHLNGTTAMVLARTRAIDDDWHRVERQRRVIIAAQKKLNSLNAVQLATTLDAIVPLINTNLSETEVADLITLAPNFLGAKVDQQTIPADGTYGSMRGMDNRPCFSVDFAANARLIRTLLYGEEAASEMGETTDDEEANEARESYSESKGTTSATTYGSSSGNGGGSSSTGSNRSGSSTATQYGQNQQVVPDVVSEAQDDTRSETGVAGTGVMGAGAAADGTQVTGADGTSQTVNPSTGAVQGTDASGQTGTADGTGAAADTTNPGNLDAATVIQQQNQILQQQTQTLEEQKAAAEASGDTAAQETLKQNEAILQQQAAALAQQQAALAAQQAAQSAQAPANVPAQPSTDQSAAAGDGAMGQGQGQ